MFIYLAGPGLSYGVWDPLPDQGSNPGLLHWELQVLTTGKDHQGNPHMSILKSSFIFFALHALKYVYVTQVASLAWDGWYFSV